MIIGSFDFILFAVLICMNVVLWGKKVKYNIGCLAVVLIFGLALPISSMKLEIDRVASEREILDNFTLLYTYLKFPIYWIIGAIQIAILTNKPESPSNNE